MRLNPELAAPLTRIGGTLWMLIGAGHLLLGPIPKLGTPVSSIAGADTFDGVFLAGSLAGLRAWRRVLFPAQIFRLRALNQVCVCYKKVWRDRRPSGQKIPNIANSLESAVNLWRNGLTWTLAPHWEPGE